ncbi:MAG TPA: cupin domain-containing protein [Stellaceae bacterium]|nr:cupin domain-containing protein [Stellaceae bacterium]
MDDMISGFRGLPACKVVRAEDAFTGKQALTYAVGISADTVGARGIHMQIISIPPKVRAKAHKHAGHESAIFVLSGKAGVWHGEHLEQHSFVQTGDFFYIPADVPHMPYNTSEAEACVVVAARTDPNEQESVVLLPELEAFVPSAVLA